MDGSPAAEALVDKPPVAHCSIRLLSKTPTRFAETAARWVFAGAICALIFVLWSPYMETAASWNAKELRVLPRMSVFIAAALMAVILQGGRPRSALLFTVALLGVFLQILLIPWSEMSHPLTLQIDSAAILRLKELGTVEIQSGPSRLLLPGVFLDGLRFELSVLSAVCAGLWLGYGLKSSGELIALLWCAIVGDVWLNYFHITESVDSQHVLNLLRVPWPPSVEHLGVSPAWTDLVFLSTIIASVKPLRLHLFSVVMGAVAGYCGAAFLALEPWPAWSTLSMGMCTSGVLISSWMELHFSRKEGRRALLLASLLFLFLVGMRWMQQRLNPPQEAQPENWTRRKNVT